MRHNTAALSDTVCTDAERADVLAPELRADADVDEAPEMREHQVPEPEDAHEEAPVPVLNRFLALRIVYGDGLRRMPSVK